MIQKFLQLFARNALLITATMLVVAFVIAIFSESFGQFAVRSLGVLLVALAGCAIMVMQTVYEFQLADAKASK